MGGCGVIQATGYRAQCSLVKNDFGSFGGLPAVGRIPYVAHDEAKTGMVDKTFQVVKMPGGKIVEAGDGIPVLKQAFAEIGAYKTSPAGNQNRFV